MEKNFCEAHFVKKMKYETVCNNTNIYLELCECIGLSPRLGISFDLDAETSPTKLIMHLASENIYNIQQPSLLSLPMQGFLQT